MIAWTDVMTTGVARLDSQHKKLIDKYNELYAAIDQGLGRHVIGEILDFLQFYADWHFGEEEHCMDEYRCPVAQLNRQAHAEFMTLFNAFYEDWHEATLDEAQVRDACAALGRWIEIHICQIDAQLNGCLDG